MPITALDSTSALVVIDLQKGLSAYPTVHPFADVVAHTARLAQAFRRARLPVVLVTVSFSADGGDRPRTRTEIPLRSLPTAPDFATIVAELGPEAGDLLIVKRQPNAFYGTELHLQLRRRQVTGIVLTGVSTSVGVDGTARAAFERSYNVTFASDAITDIDPTAHDFVMQKSFLASARWGRRTRSSRAWPMLEEPRHERCATEAGLGAHGPCSSTDGRIASLACRISGGRPARTSCVRW